jgi:hypothetical protein
MDVICPNCRSAMAAETHEAQPTLRAVEAYSCASCNLFWFDGMASIQLSPRAVLGLFESIGRASATGRTPLASNFSCPRCQNLLAFTHDLQRTTRFTFWRCPLDRGQLITFNQFLRQKNFIRAPSPAELARLRATVRQIACSQCGAPIDLANDNACPHCGAAVALIDPDGVAKALHDLASGAALAAPADATQTSARLSDAQIDAIFDVARLRDSEGTSDLVAIGAAAIGGLLGALMLSRY